MADYLRLVEKGTSVKSIGVLVEPTATDAGVGDFLYRDQYSVFDWGKMPMPDSVVMDNRPVAVVAAFNYEMLEDSIPISYVCSVDEEGNGGSLQWFRNHGKVPRGIRVKLVNVIKPTFDATRGVCSYAVFQNPPVNNYVLPIEFIWRAAAGQESSFWRNIEKKAYALSDFGLPTDLKPGQPFPSPVLDHSSKYESFDRYFPPQEARRLAALSETQWEELNWVRKDINARLSRHAEEAHIYRPDGKQEFCVITGTDRKPEIYLADVAGTWHEDRFEYTTAKGRKVKVSKQTPRDLNRILNAAWAEQCEAAKTRAEREGSADWKAWVTLQPQALEPQFFAQYNNLMYAATNAWVGWNVFSGASPLEEACVEFDKYLADYKVRL